MTELRLTLNGRETSVAIDTVIVAGWTGRDRAAVEKHMAELEAVGVPRPSSAPVFYRVSASRLTTAQSIESTAASSGEVEPVLLQHDGRLWVGTGSDHTDREVESYGVNVSKQLCDKPIAAEFWLYDEVAEHWDELELRSWVDGDVLYQEGALSGLMHPDDLRPKAEPPLADGTVMFCGTLAAIGGIRPAGEFRYELSDPVRGRRISGRYEMRTLPLVS
ncbi:MAG TPA: DUF2848 domain-containing protein [Thermoleophilaceae bacterium]|nr:DUF2848 domain-containing protein [Thermoleophilaceae bacterium]